MTLTHSLAAPLSTAIAAAVLCMPLAAAAVEVRVGESRTVFASGWSRDYVPCTAPNDVARSGVAACRPPVTSACDFSPSTFSVTQDPAQVPFGNRGLNYRNAECGHSLDATVRVSGGPYIDPNPETLPCPSGYCTFQDSVNNSEIGVNLTGVPPLIPPHEVFSEHTNYEILGILFTGLDGLPAATIGLQPDLHAWITSANLTVPYEPCTAPLGSACDLVPWDAACDFESGTITWEQPDTLSSPSVHVLLNDVAGSSPLCTNGTYHLETTVRATVDGCSGIPIDPERCTLVDQTFSLPLIANGRRLDATVALPLGNLGLFGRYLTTEILSARVIDPTGRALAVPGTSNIRHLLKPQVLIKDDEIRIKGRFPVESPDALLDPTAGFTVTVTDRDGLVYATSIPSILWQLQPPLGSQWTYQDAGGVIDGVRKARVKRLGGPGAGKGYSVDLRAAGVDLSAADFPGVTVVVGMGDVVSTFVTTAVAHRTCVVKGSKRSCK